MICYVYLTFTQYPYSCSSYEKMGCAMHLQPERAGEGGKEGRGSCRLNSWKSHVLLQCQYLYSIAQLQVHSPSLHNSYLVAIFTRKERVLKGI